MGINNFIKSSTLCLATLFSLSGVSFANTQPEVNVETYEISSREGLIDKLDSLERSSAPVIVKLKVDIDFEGANFEPWTLGKNVTFDGNGHSLKNIWVSETETQPLGVFSVNEGVITNLKIENLKMFGTDTVGGLVGVNGETARVESVEVTGVVSGEFTVGGIIGENNGVLSKSLFSGKVYGENKNNREAGSFIGGLVGSALSHSTVDLSRAIATVKGGQIVGGLIGQNYNAFLSLSTFYGTVDGTFRTGGLVGESYFSSNRFSYAIATVTGVSHVGGLIGGSVESLLGSSHFTGDVRGRDFIGGLVGNGYYSEVKNSYSVSSVKGGKYVGSFVGSNDSGVVSSSYAFSTDGVYHPSVGSGDVFSGVTDGLFKTNGPCTVLEGEGAVFDVFVKENFSSEEWSLKLDHHPRLNGIEDSVSVKVCN